MIARIQKSLEERETEGGFTLVELLVVIIIIGILAAIAIPAFLNQRQNAWVSQVESDLRNAAIAAESYAVGNNGSYEDLNTAALATNGFNKSAETQIEVEGEPTTEAYTLTGGHDNLGEDEWVYDSTSGTITGPDYEAEGEGGGE